MLRDVSRHVALTLVDEFFAQDQFKALCQAHSQLIFDPQTAAGRTIYLEKIGRQSIEGTWVPMTIETWRFRDVKTREPVASFELIFAKAGFLGRSLGLTQSPSPFLFDAFCAPVGYGELFITFDKIGITRTSLPKQ
ncbi:hypothetical protein [Undibacterium terreum]|uniref:Uncharacterized protein n=1 Tax=Undibacterium terreum TaxID=1224302 RepID=A0A916UB20_9BURK|nr:hypothetical protein [Undibacterium terreum]GGC66467.1 hypothetical protein GCM10011396_11930 [Undibacterium terreum]